MHATHTPAPWKIINEKTIVGPDHPGQGYIADVNMHRSPGVQDPPDGAANAAHIVRCVNSHDAIIQALKLARRKIELWPEGSNPEYFPEIKAIDAALAAAEAP